MAVAVGVSYRVGQNDSMGSLIKRFCNISEPFLPCGVPDVERDRLAIVLDAFDLKIDSYRTQVISLKTVFTIPHQ